MNAVEKLEAAIAKLEALRDAGTPGPWEASRGYIEGGPFAGNDITPTEVNCMSYCLGGSPQPMRAEDADLIVTLHRTIEPQLAILRLAIQFDAISPNRYTEAALDLAAHILGESNADVG